MRRQCDLKLTHLYLIGYFFFFQAEDGIRYLIVTGVQTCALPICRKVATLVSFSPISIAINQTSHGLFMKDRNLNCFRHYGRLTRQYSCVLAPRLYGEENRRDECEQEDRGDRNRNSH